MNDFLVVISITLVLIVLFSSLNRRTLERELNELKESLQHEDRKLENRIQQLEQRIVDLESDQEKNI